MRLGIDMGTNSIGWWIYRQGANGKLEGTLACGVRIFSDGRDPQSKASLAVARRDARAARRRRDRFLRRRAALLDKLAQVGLMPLDPSQAKMLEAIDPYELRAEALNKQLALEEIGRALFHINQRRGFKSNRKADAKNNEGGKIKDGAARLDLAMQEAGTKTYGAFLHMRRKASDSPNKMKQVRTRMGTVTEDGQEMEGYGFYPMRHHLEDEFKRIYEAQAAYYPDILSDELYAELFEIVFYQRPLKESKIGFCQFEPEERLPKAHPLFQERRLYEAVNALRVQEAGEEERPLTLEERDKLVLKLRDVRSSTFKSLATLIGLTPQQSFNLQNDRRTELEGNEVRAAMIGASRFGNQWSGFDINTQWEIIDKLRKTDYQDALMAWLMTNFELDEERAENIADAKLPEGYGRLGITATKKILEALKADVVVYSEAVAKAGYHHSDMRTGEVFTHLPYYGQVLQSSVIPGDFGKEGSDPVKNAPDYWGRITNPTVHIALGQLRHLVNDIIDVYGLPDEIVVELARDLKNSEDQKGIINKKIAENTKAAIKRGEELENEFGEKWNTGRNRAVMRIWESLNSDPTARLCPYCCKPIGIQSLFDGSTDIDHVLPYSRTLDDSFANKVIAHQGCNQIKGNKTPYEAWGHDAARWADISANLKNLPKATQWRFAPNAMERYDDEKGFLARQLTDTQFLARLTRQYLEVLYPEKGRGSQHVKSVSGKLTEMLRRKWRLNELLPDANHHDVTKKKNRQDHRHHAVDAAVIATVDRSLVKRVADASKREDGEAKKLKISPPYKNFREEIRQNIQSIVVSHKLDHGTIKAHDPHVTAAKLHNDTAYGITGKANEKDIPLVVTRKPLANLTHKDIEKIRDEDLKAALYSVTQGLSGKALSEALVRFAQQSPHYAGIRRVRLIEPITVIPIQNENGRYYKGYKGDSNHCVEVWALPDGKWKAEILTTFDAHQKGLGSTRPHPASRLVMRLFKGDTVELEHPKSDGTIWIIAKMSKAEINLYPPNEGNVRARNDDKADPFSYLRIGLGTFQKYDLQKIGIDRLGRVMGARS